MINVDLQKIYGSIKSYNTEKWHQPITINREETRDNKENDAKNRQQTSYNEILNHLTDSLLQNRSPKFSYTV